MRGTAGGEELRKRPGVLPTAAVSSPYKTWRQWPLLPGRLGRGLKGLLPHGPWAPLEFPRMG